MGRPKQKEQPGEQPAGDAGISLASILEQTLGELSEDNFYTLAEFVFNARVEELKQFGELRRLPEITSEDELDDHFDELARLYRQTCQELGLAWPPPALDTGFERELDREVRVLTDKNRVSF